MYVETLFNDVHNKLSKKGDRTMKRYIRSETDFNSKKEKGERSVIDLRRDLMSILSKMWRNGGARETTMKDFKNSDYSSLSKYIADHKPDIFDRDEVLDKIDELASKTKNYEKNRQKMIDMYDNLKESEFARVLLHVE